MRAPIRTRVLRWTAGTLALVAVASAAFASWALAWFGDHIGPSEETACT